MIPRVSSVNSKQISDKASLKTRRNTLAGDDQNLREALIHKWT